jgi:hypothetical protein
VSCSGEGFVVRVNLATKLRRSAENFVSLPGLGMLTTPAIVQREHGRASPLITSARQTPRVRSRDDSWAHRDRDRR